jgi:hypothetical protein
MVDEVKGGFGKWGIKYNPDKDCIVINWAHHPNFGEICLYDVNEDGEGNTLVYLSNYFAEQANNLRIKAATALKVGDSVQWYNNKSKKGTIIALNSKYATATIKWSAPKKYSSCENIFDLKKGK